MSDDNPDNWRSVVDPSSGRTYWYHRRTRETTWNKPACLQQPKQPQPELQPDAGYLSSKGGQNETANNQLRDRKDVIERYSNEPVKQKESVKSHIYISDKNLPVVTEKSNNARDFQSAYKEDFHQLIPLKTQNYVNRRESVSLESIIRLLINGSEDNIVMGIQLLTQYVSEILVIDSILKSIPTIISHLVRSIQELKSTPHKVMAFRLLWILSLSPSSHQYFVSNPSWTSLIKVVLKSGVDEYAFYYSALVSFMLISPDTRNLVSDEIDGALCEWFSILAKDSKQSSMENMFALSRNSLGNNMSLFDGSTLMCVADISTRGFIVPGLLLNLLFSFLLHVKERDIADNILMKFGLPAMYHMLSGFSTSYAVREGAKNALRDGMGISPVIRHKVLDMFIDLSGAVNALGHPAKQNDPRHMYIPHNNMNHEVEDHNEVDLNASGEILDQPILRDIEWKPQHGRPWRLCSGIMWVRCPGLRGILDEFWDAGGGGLELNIDASWDTLNSTCYYIHTSVLIPPVRFLYKLELVKVAMELEMPYLVSLAIENVEQHLTAEYIAVTMEFSEALEIYQLKEFCENFMTAKNSGSSICNLEVNNVTRANILSKQMNDDFDLKSAIVESINAVASLENGNNAFKPTTTYGLTNDPVTARINQNSAYDDVTLKTRNNSISQKKTKSGGIYGLLLNTMDGPGENASLLNNDIISHTVMSVPSTVPKPASSVPGRDMSVKSSKPPLPKNDRGKETSSVSNSAKASVKDKKQVSSNSKGKNGSTDKYQDSGDNSVEYSDSMSLSVKRPISDASRR
jgi:WW domain